MSAVATQVRTKIFETLRDSDPVGNLVGDRIYYRKAPNIENTYPFVVFSRVPIGARYTLGDNFDGEDDEWLFKSLCPEDLNPSKSAEKTNDEVLAAVEAALSGMGVSITFGTISLFRRVRDMPEFEEVVGDQTIRHQGAFFSAITEKQ